MNEKKMALYFLCAHNLLSLLHVLHLTLTVNVTCSYFIGALFLSKLYPGPSCWTIYQMVLLPQAIFSVDCNV